MSGPTIHRCGWRRKPRPRLERPLSKTVVAEMLRGIDFPLAVMLSFLRACRVPDNAIEPWQRAWERVAESRHPEAHLEDTQRPGTPPIADEKEIIGLREENSQLAADNEKLRLAQLAREMDDSTPQISLQPDPATGQRPRRNMPPGIWR